MDTLALYDRLSKFPFGKKIFTFFFCWRLPYFFSIRPTIVELAEGRAVVRMTERWRVQNHIPTIHAIAQCNLCEAAMAIATTVTIPDHLRFIPVGMTVAYNKPAKGTIRAIAAIGRDDFIVGKTDVPVAIYDQHDVLVMSAVITLDIKEKKR